MKKKSSKKTSREIKENRLRHSLVGVYFTKRQKEKREKEIKQKKWDPTSSLFRRRGSGTVLTVLAY